MARQPRKYGISESDYDGYIKEYSNRIQHKRPLTVNREYELINLSDLGNPHAPLMIKRNQELINLENLEELYDPRDPKFRTHRDIDMRFWTSPKSRTESRTEDNSPDITFVIIGAIVLAIGAYAYFTNKPQE